MERNFNNEFERFLKENADQYRLYPSSRVWNGIYTTLHTRRKWFGLGIALLLITGILVTLLITNSSKETVITANKPVVHKQIPVSDLQVSSADKRISSIKPKNNSVNTFALRNQIAIPQNNFYKESINDLVNLKENNYHKENENSFDPSALNITDELTDQDIINDLHPQKTFEYPKKLTTSNSFNWTIESVLNSFAANAPTTYPPLYDINSKVTHKPDMGLEFGLTTKYALTSNFKVKAGLQFNINRYDIKAFNTSFEVARIALRGNTGVDSFYAVSTHRNFSGYKSDWLQNFYFEVSMPVGVEVNLIGDEKVQFGIAGTIQPTYILGDRAYLLSTDYKNYAEVPWLTRHWNINTGLETFVSYSTGKMKWQVGPQVRYQLLSSFIDKYPVKENLFDFGFKIGISSNK